MVIGARKVKPNALFSLHRSRTPAYKALVIDRPYVLAFLAAFLWLASRRFGWPRALFWLVSGFVIAWLSEVASINTGFPYGWYFYKYENLRRDWLLCGVPVWDSLSYPFLIYAGWSVALRRARALPHRSPWPVQIRFALIAAFNTMILDMITDPVAHLGDRWFLGDIYGYRFPGWYFGIPATNFAGWFVVPLAVVLLNLLWWQLAPAREVAAQPKDSDRRRPSNVFTRGHVTWNPRLGQLFYGSIALFNIGIALWLREYALALCSCGLAVVAYCVSWKHAARSARKNYPQIQMDSDNHASKL